MATSSNAASKPNGDVLWIDGSDNWTKNDAYWINDRLVVRVPSVPPTVVTEVSRDTGTTVRNINEGRVFYDTTNNRLSVSTDGTTDGFKNVAASKYLAVTDSTYSTDGTSVTIGHSSYDGIIFTHDSTNGSAVTLPNITGNISLVVPSSGLPTTFTGNIGSFDTGLKIDTTSITYPYNSSIPTNVPSGSISYDRPTGTLVRLYNATGNLSGYQKLWNQPWGTLSRTELSSDVTISSTNTTFSVSNKSSTISSGVVTAILTTTASHGYSIGDHVVVSGVSGSSTTTVFNGAFTITAVTTTTFGYVTTGAAAVTSTAVSPNGAVTKFSDVTGLSPSSMALRSDRDYRVSINLALAQYGGTATVTSFTLTNGAYSLLYARLPDIAVGATDSASYFATATFNGAAGAAIRLSYNQSASSSVKILGTDRNSEMVITDIGPATVLVTNKQRSGSTTYTLTTVSPHPFVVGKTIVVTGVDASGTTTTGFDGVKTITAVTSTTVSWTGTSGTNVSYATDGGVVSAGPPS
jgi:hypothetical protein